MSHRQVLRLAVLAVTAFVAFGPLRTSGGKATTGFAPGATPYARADAASQSRTLTFDDSVTALNRQAFLLAVSRMRPEAARLVDRVDGLVTVVDGEPPPGALGITSSSRHGYVIRLPFGRVYHQ